MGLIVCPAVVIAAPVELVWANLVQWERYSEWADNSPCRLRSRTWLLPVARWGRKMIQA